MTTDQGLIQSFLEIKIAETGASKNTIAAYERDLKDFVTWLQGNKIKLLKVTQKQIESYLIGQEQKGFAPTTRARRLSVIKQDVITGVKQGGQTINHQLIERGMPQIKRGNNRCWDW